MQAAAEALLLGFSMDEIRQSRKMKRFDSSGSWFWHIPPGRLLTDRD